MMRGRRGVWIAIIGALCLVLNLCAFNMPAEASTKSVMESKKPVVWRLGHAAYQGEITHMWAEKVIEEIEKAFEGKVKVEHFPAGQLGSYTAMAELLQNGALEFNIPATAAPLGQFVPEAKFLSINFMLSEHYDVNDKALNEGKAMRLLEQKLEEQNIKVLRWFLEDFSCWSSNYPIQKLEDLKGLKIRVYPSSQIVANYRVLGANPTEVPYAEVYSALQLHVADAQENPVSTIYSNKYYEVQKYVILSNHTGVINGFSAGKAFWDGLAREDQEKIENAVEVAMDYTFSKMDEMVQYAKEQILASGNTEILELDPEERARIVEASIPAKEEFLKDSGEHGEEIIALWKEDVKKYEAELIGQ